MPTKWKILTAEDKMIAFDHLDMKLDIHLDEETMEMVENLLKNRSRDQRCKLHKFFESFGSVEKARRNKSAELTQENWDALCTYWSDPKIIQDEMVQMEKKSIEKGNPMSRDQIHDKVMKQRAGYIQGLGYGPKPSKSLSSAANQRNKKLEESLQDLSKSVNNCRSNFQWLKQM